MKAKCTGGEIQDDGRWIVYLEVPEGTHIQIDDEWEAAPVAAGQPDAATDAEMRAFIEDYLTPCPVCFQRLSAMTHRVSQCLGASDKASQFSTCPVCHGKGRPLDEPPCPRCKDTGYVHADKSSGDASPK